MGVFAAGSRVLVVAPHPDDEILGAGGTIARCSAEDCEVAVLTVSGHLPPLYPREAYDRTVEEARAAYRRVGVRRSAYLEIPATYVHTYEVAELNGRILEYVREVDPTIVLCPFPDRHIDHRAIFEAVMVVTRPVADGINICMVAAYETLSETHWNAAGVEPTFTPNWTVDITDHIEAKVEALQCFESQISPAHGPRSLEAVRALAGFRGTQAGFPYGESFQIIRMRSIR
jgi:N-acetylglucosamine malate deacetylase 1